MSLREPAAGAARLAGAATLIAVLTIAARVTGFGRYVVFTQTVGFNTLGDIYVVANTIPNIIFEIVAGGALAGLVVPVLAGPLARGDTDAVRRVAGALLTWAAALLIPLALLLALAAGPIIRLLAGADASEAQLAAGTTLLQVFAPQLPLYGIGIVLTGVLQAHRRFAWPVLAPLLSSLTVIATYLVFARVAGTRPGLAEVDTTQLLILGVGTTLGVVVLSLCLIIPVRRLGLGLRPGFRMQPAERRTAGGLALAGAGTVAAQQLALLVALTLAFRVGDGMVTTYQMAQTFFLLPWAVLAVPVATAAFPEIATRYSVADSTEQRQAAARTVARTGQAVLLLSFLGVAGLAAIARPVADLLRWHEPGQAATLAPAIIAFAPGLVGYGLGALHQRTLYATGAQRWAVAAVASGWGVAAVAALAFSAGLPAEGRAIGLAAANSAGMLVLGLALAYGVRRRCGAMALDRLPRAALAGAAAAAAAVLAAWAVQRASYPAPGPEGIPAIWPLIGQGMLSGGVALLVFTALCALLAGPQLRAALARVAARMRRR